MSAQKSIFACLMALFAALPLASSGQNLSLIPIPQSVLEQKGQFVISPKTTISTAQQGEAMDWVIGYLNQHLQNRLGSALPVQTASKAKPRSIRFMLNPAAFKEEAYKLNVTPREILISAGSEAGLFYAVQTLIQLFPDKKGALAVPAVIIEDQPAFSYRGMHLDVGRHFFPVSFIKQYIDIMARYKMNRFHWHLTEDQGWRIEIKKYPKLQEIAAYRDETLIGHYSDQPHKYDGKRYGGYYTQEEIREVVEYARERFITIIPEIELPGHAQAAVAAYPELGCTGKPIKPATKWGVFEDVFCPSETTFSFLEDVLKEVMDLFPSEYIHIGGDECPKTQWKTSPVAQEVIKREGLKDEHELQSYFIRRIEKFLNANGRQIIGWDEILEGGLAPNATVMSWRGVAGGIEAAKQKHEVIMTPTSHCYFDYYQADHPDEPLAIGGYLPLEKVYGFNPVPKELQGELAQYVIGAQGNVWTEYMKDEMKVQYMVYPRMQALAEVVWSGEAKKDFPGFVKRLLPHLERFKQEGIAYANHLFDVNPRVVAGDGKGVRVQWTNLSQLGSIHVSKNAGQPAVSDPAVSGEQILSENGRYTAQTFINGQPTGRSASLNFQSHLAAGKAIQLANPPAPQYSAAGPGSVINGIVGSDERYGDAEWLGFEGKDFEAVIDFGEPVAIRRVALRFFNGPGQWIYPPKSVQLSLGDFPGQFGQELSSNIMPANALSGKIIRHAMMVNSKARFLRVRIPNYGVIPDGQQGAGHKAWLFVDEIEVW